MFNFRREIFADLRRGGNAEGSGWKMSRISAQISHLRQPIAFTEDWSSTSSVSTWLFRMEKWNNIYYTIYIINTHVYIYYVTICFMNLFYWIVCFGDTMGTLRYIPDFWSSIIQIVLEKHLHLGVNPRSAGKTATFNVFLWQLFYPWVSMGFGCNWGEITYLLYLWGEIRK